MNSWSSSSIPSARLCTLSTMSFTIHDFYDVIHNRLPRNFIESIINVMLFAAGICFKSLVLRSYLTSFLIKYSCIKGGSVLLIVLYISQS